MGIMVISYTVKEVHDDVGYLSALGQARTAEVQRDARVGKAKKVSAMSGNRTRVTCLEGSYAHHYTNIAF